MEKETMTARIFEHDVRNQLGNIYLAVEGIKAEFSENNNEDIASYTDIIINCCKQLEKLVKQVNINQ